MLPEERADLLSRKQLHDSTDSTSIQREQQASFSSNLRRGGDYVDLSRRACPVCKSFCSVKQIIPIYVRSDTSDKQNSHVIVEEIYGSKTQSMAKASSIDAESSKYQSNKRKRSLSTGDLGDMIASPEHDFSIQIENNFNTINSTTASQTRQTQMDQPLPSSQAQTYENNISTFGLRRRIVRSTSYSTSDSTRSERNKSNSISESPIPLRPLPPRSLVYTHLVNTSNTYSQYLSSDGTVSDANRLSNSSQMPRSLFQSLLGLPYETLFSSRPSSSIGTNAHLGQSGIPISIASTQEYSQPISASRRFRNTSINDSRYHVDDINVEDAATDFLSRLLLMLGSFVILCLLLF